MLPPFAKSTAGVLVLSGIVRLPFPIETIKRHVPCYPNAMHWRLFGPFIDTHREPKDKDEVDEKAYPQSGSMIEIEKPDYKWKSRQPPTHSTSARSPMSSSNSESMKCFS